ncbi:OsmC family protein [Arhodomonas aquaeolei]|uniref:OsmC family protein n=1 Tax=Arhodomonas aquaeolei TaxID=2369 RepID=UPI00036B819B|nr:OsmC family protein [Arhodomonas aquaeolei]
MQSLPHHYRVRSAGEAEGTIAVTSDGLDTIRTAPPEEFGGPGGHWTPEHLFVASIADCFVLSFRAVARASRLEWLHLACDVDGELDRPDRALCFTRVTLRPRLEIADEGARDAALRCLEKAERACLITNSLDCEVSLDPSVEVRAGG